MHRLTALTLCALLLPACYAADAIHDLPEELVEGEYVLGMSEEATETSLTEWAMEEGLELVERRWVAARGSERAQRFQRRLARTCIRRH